MDMMTDRIARILRRATCAIVGHCDPSVYEERMQRYRERYLRGVGIPIAVVDTGTRTWDRPRCDRCHARLDRAQ